jgi:membrane-associated phospholipid phosphatase
VHTTSTGRAAAPAVPTRSTTRALLTVAACAVVLVLLGWAVVTDWPPLMHLDRAVSTALYVGDDRSPLVWLLLQVATGPGSFGVRMVLFLPVLVWLVLRRAWWTAAWVLTATALVSPLTDLLKDLVGRPRPQFAGGGARYESLSFPSGHCSGIATLVTVALVLGWPLLPPVARRAGLAAGVVLVLLVGLTRMWLGVHFLSDVLGGWAFGLGWTLLVAVAFGALPGGRAALPERSA